MAVPFERHLPAEPSLDQGEGPSIQDVRAAVAATEGLPLARHRAAAAQIVHTTTTFEFPDVASGTLFTTPEADADPMELTSATAPNHYETEPLGYDGQQPSFDDGEEDYRR